jgi:phospholipid/cholesterol/gamma-HCH transport system substrate-binding protein
MTGSLSRSRSWLLTAVVLGILFVGAGLLIRIGERQGLFRKTFPITLEVSDAHDVQPGTSVRIRGVEVGRVSAVEFVDSEELEGRVRLTLSIDETFRPRIFNDAQAQIHSRGLLGTSVISITPGKPTSGLLEGTQVRVTAQPDLGQVTAKLHAVAERTEALLQEISESNGTLVKLLRDDDIHRDLKQITQDTRGLLKNANETITQVKSETGTVRDFVRNGQEAVQSLKQNSDAIKSLPIIRDYVEDAPSILIRPNCTSERSVYAERHLFQPGTAILTTDGREYLQEVAAWLNSHKERNSEIVVVSYADSRSNSFNATGAKKLTEKQAQTVVEFLRDKGVHKLSFWTRRTITPLGMGHNPSPVVEKEALPPAHVQILLFVPQ